MKHFINAPKSRQMPLNALDEISNSARLHADPPRLPTPKSDCTSADARALAPSQAVDDRLLMFNFSSQERNRRTK
jgi:hypothetical protein